MFVFYLQLPICYIKITKITIEELIVISKKQCSTFTENNLNSCYFLVMNNSPSLLCDVVSIGEVVGGVSGGNVSERLIDNNMSQSSLFYIHC